MTRLHYCRGKLEVRIANESSMRCTVCGWTGWPRQEVDSKTGLILRRWPHRCACGQDPPWPRGWTHAAAQKGLL